MGVSGKARINWSTASHLKSVLVTVCHAQIFYFFEGHSSAMRTYFLLLAIILALLPFRRTFVSNRPLSPVWAPPQRTVQWICSQQPLPWPPGRRKIYAHCWQDGVCPAGCVDLHPRTLQSCPGTAWWMKWLSASSLCLAYYWTVCSSCRQNKKCDQEQGVVRVRLLPLRCFLGAALPWHDEGGLPHSPRNTPKRRAWMRKSGF